MSVFRYVLPALAVAGGVFAQSCDSDEIIIQNQGDAGALRNCATLSGDVIIAASYEGTVSLDGVQKIEGNLNCTNAREITSISAGSLGSIGKGFILTNLTILSDLGFPQLTTVDSIQWRALPALQNLTFGSKVSKAKNVLITNTQLQSLEGIDLEEVENFNINNNPYLTSLDLQLSNITTSLTVQANSKNLIVDLPDLVTALNMTFRNCSEVNLPRLGTVNGSLIFDDNFFKTFTAPNLTETGDIVFVGNPDLTNISLPSLTTIGGGYQIANNSKLMGIDGFRKLKTVDGAIDFSGNFTNVTLPALSDVKGGFNLQTSGELDCGPFEEAANNGVIKGTYVCAAKQADPGTAGNPTSAPGAKSTKKAAAGQLSVNSAAVIGMSSLVAGILSFLL